MKYEVKSSSGQIVGSTYSYAEAEQIKSKSLDYQIVIIYL